MNIPERTVVFIRPEYPQKEGTFLGSHIPPVGRIISGPTKSAVETAHLLAAGLDNPPVEIEKRLAVTEEGTANDLMIRAIGTYTFRMVKHHEDLAFVIDKDLIGIIAYRCVGKNAGPIPPREKLEQHNRLHPGEALVVRFDETGRVISQEIIPQPVTNDIAQ
ncbi:hypothetical protein HYV22_03545 [Candidatus Gottesmanbacteria bacterium]|nr:hypothetical protein [Candidatus Gottesmanbacteria bacterium]